MCTTQIRWIQRQEEPLPPADEEGERVAFWKYYSVQERRLEKVLRLVWSKFSLKAQKKLEMGSEVWPGQVTATYIVWPYSFGNHRCRGIAVVMDGFLVEWHGETPE